MSETAGEVDAYAFRIVTGKIDIRIFGDGHVEGWPPSWQDGAQFLIFNRIPAQVAAAEQIGYALGYEEARVDLSPKQTILNVKMDDGRKQEG